MMALMAYQVVWRVACEAEQAVSRALPQERAGLARQGAGGVGLVICDGGSGALLEQSPGNEQVAADGVTRLTSRATCHTHNTCHSHTPRPRAGHRGE